MNNENVQNLLKRIPKWSLIKEEGIFKIQRSYKFKNFKQALNFTNMIGDMAENVGHHPSLLTEWGRVRVTWWSHSINGLQEIDIICAKKTDALDCF